MPQHPAWHHAPADQFGARTNRQLERLTAPDPDGLADVDGLTAARMLVGDLDHHRLAPVAPCDPVRRAASHGDIEREFRLEFEPGWRALAWAVGRCRVLENDALAT